MKEIYKQIAQMIKDGKIDKGSAALLLKQLRTEEKIRSRAIAVIGMALHFPHADTPDAFWNVLQNGMDCITAFPKNREAQISHYVSSVFHLDEPDYQSGGFLGHIDRFDDSFFHISPREAELMDPNQRLLLQTAVEAMEDAGYGGTQLDNTKTGVYIGYANVLKDSYQNIIFHERPDLIPQSIINNLSAELPSRIAYLLNLKGPTMVIDTACSSSLVCIHTACRAILNGDCEQALAGGIKLQLVPVNHESYRVGVETESGRTRTFDDQADGACMGEGVAVVFLKPLEKAVSDGDHVYAVVKGSAINQDGSTIGITAPNPEAQAEVLAAAWQNAGINPEALDYIVSHGTGTRLGDPVELKGIRAAFRRYTDKKQFCAIGSVKPNVGHLFECSGVANLIAGILALRHRQIPPSLHFQHPNRTVGFCGGPVYVNTKLRDWNVETGEKRLCGINSFGLSGTNCHVVLEEAPEPVAVACGATEGPRVFTLSAKSRASLSALLDSYRRFFADGTAPFDAACYTSNVGRGHYGYRIALLADDMRDLLRKMDRISAGAPGSVPDSGLFYGYHQLVPAGVHDAGTVTEAEIARQDELGRVLVERLAAEPGQENGAVLYRQLCELYVQGAHINWRPLYPEDARRKIPLPAYCFDGRPCWIPANPQAKSHSDGFFSVRWTPKPIAPTAQAGSAVLVFAREESPAAQQIVRNLSDAGKTVTLIVRGDGTQQAEKTSANHLFAAPGDRARYETIFRETAPSHILLLLSPPEDDTAQAAGLSVLLSLVQAIGREAAVQLLLLGDYVYPVTGDEPYRHPQNAPLFGFLKGVEREYRNIRCRAIDADTDFDTTRLLEEMAAPDELPVIAYRGGRRYAEQLTESAPERYPASGMQIRDGGVYLITGGTGGIGLEMARFLAEKKRIVLILAGRTALPNRSEWDALEEHPDTGAPGEKIRRIRALERTGAHVLTECMDVSDPAAVRACLNRVKSAFGRLDGVIHAAGIAGNALLEDETLHNTLGVLKPKVSGAMNLLHAVQDEPLDFCLFFSSIATVLPAPGQAGYIAANAFLDACAGMKAGKSAVVKVINWSTWKETGMAFRHHVNMDTIFESLPTETALAYFDAVWDRAFDRLLIGRPNPKLMFLMEKEPILLSETIDRGHVNREAAAAVQTVRPVLARANVQGAPELLGKSSDAYTPTEQKLAGYLYSTLGFDRVNVYDNFFEMGMDSISIVRLTDEIKKDFQISLAFSVFLDNPTIYNVAKAIDVGAGVRTEKPDTVVPPSGHGDHFQAFPLSKVQASYLFGREKKYELGGIATHAYMEIRTERDIPRLNRALRKLIERHDMLRAVILPDGTQKFLESCPDYSIRCDDLSELGAEEAGRHVQALRDRMSHRVYLAGEWPLFEIRACRMDHNTNLLFISIDMLIADAVSLEIIINELTEYYEDETLSLPQLQYSFRDYQIALARQADSPEYARDKAYWLERLELFPDAPRLPYRTALSAISHVRFRRLEHLFSKQETDRVNELAHRHGVTLSAALCCAYAFILSLYCNQRSLAINLATFNRKQLHPEVDQLVGDFTSVILLASELDFDRDFWANAQRLQSTMMEGLEHRLYEGVEFIGELAQKNGTPNAAVMPVVFTSMLYQGAGSSIGKLGQITYAISQTSQVVLDNQVREVDGALQFNWDYVESAFEPQEIEKIFDGYISYIQSVAAGRIDAPVLNEDDRRLIEAYNHTEWACAPVSPAELFEKQAAARPEATAVICEGERITYGDLDARSNRLANYLKSHGVSRGNTVGILSARQIETIVNILAVLKCRAAYVPIDPGYPKSRCDYILENSCADLLIETDFYKEHDVGQYPADRLPEACVPDDVAYLIYTSGSTGKPKGVIISNKSACNTVLDMNRRFHVTERDIFLGISSLCFDLSVYDVFGALSCGGALVMVPDQHDIGHLIETVAQQRVTIWNSVPAIMNLAVEFCENDPDARLSSLRLVLLSGDWIPLKLPDRIRRHAPDAQTISLGGATEGSIWSIYYPIDAVDASWRSIPYGMPLANQTIYIVSGDGRLCPVATPGEICIGGIGVANGYANNEAQTTASFIAHPQLGRLYKTGDFGILTSAGYVEFLGRRDAQVKINGYRVELSEVEKCIEGLAGVEAAKAVVLQGKGGSHVIGAFVKAGRDVTAQAVQQHAAAHLPRYMVPTTISILEAFPLTFNGKVDVKKLSATVEPEQQTVRETGASNQTEERLIRIFKETLHLEAVGIHTSFFDMGVNSIQIIQIANKIHTVFNKKIAFKDFIDKENISELASLLQDTEQAAEDEVTYRSVAPDLANLNEPFPLTQVQTAYLMGREKIFELGGVSTHGYAEMENALEPDRLNAALEKLIARHPMMRMVILENGMQQILKYVPKYRIEVVDLRGLPDEEKQQRLMDERARMSHYIFDPGKWPLFDLRIYRLENAKNAMFVGYDLLMADGMSIQVISRELMAYYEHPDTDLHPIFFSFRDYVLALEDFKQNSKTYQSDRAYWLEKLEDFPFSPALPLKMPPSEVEQPHFRRLSKVFGQRDWSRIKEFAASQSVTPSSLICSIYAKVLAFWSNSNRFALNLTVFNRYPFHEDVNAVIGDFTSVLLLDISLNPGHTLVETAQQTQKTIMSALQHRHYEGVDFIRDIAKRYNLERKAIMPVVFTSMIFGEMDHPEPYRSKLGKIEMSVSQTSQVYLDNQVSDSGNQLTITWDYVEELFDPDVVAKMFDQYTGMLTQILEGPVTGSIGVDQDAFRQILDYNQTQKPMTETTLAELMERQAALHAEQIAVMCEGTSVSYGELSRKSNRIARYLKSKGIARGAFVGVLTARRIESVANILGVLKAGAAYVPINPDYPQKRREYMYDNCGCSLLLVPDTYEEEQLERLDDSAMLDGRPEDVAYVIHTSGSTGNPKGVVISNQAACNTILDINEKFGVSGQDRILGISSMCFDLSVYDLFGAFAAGATLVIVPDQRDIAHLLELVEREKITVWNSVPAIMELAVGQLNRETGAEPPRMVQAAARPSAMAPRENELYYWSPAVHWTERDGHIMAGDYVCPDEMAKLMPAFYFRAQAGATLAELAQLYGAQSDSFPHFLKELTEHRVLVNSILPPDEIFAQQNKMFVNPYAEDIIYNYEANLRFKEEQLNRTVVRGGKPVTFPNRYQYPPSIANRRSVRDYDTERPVPFDTLCAFLSVMHQNVEDRHYQYYYASAGGLYPIDIYLHVKPGRVENLEQGIYYYNPVANSLQLVEPNPTLTEAAHYYTNKKIFKSSAFSVFFLYNAGANMPKYAGKGYFYAILDAGILAATLTHTAELIHLGTCSIGDMMFRKVEADFHLNCNQVWVHTMEVGLKKAENGTAPEMIETITVNRLESGPAEQTVEQKTEETPSFRAGQWDAASLRLVLLSGDWIPLHLAGQIKTACPNAQIISLGGATEASIWSIYYPIRAVKTEWSSIPYGMPLANQTIYIMGLDEELCPIGTPGEIMIGGAGVAEAYINDEQKTQAAFVVHPKLGRLYKTGDYGIFRPEGYVEFLGRKDSQIEIGGHRIELGEITANLEQNPNTAKCVSVPYTDTNGIEQICSYVVLKNAVLISELRAYLKERLPDYMVPARILEVNEIPLTDNGKLNTKALPDPRLFGRETASYEGPSTEIEQKLEAIVAQYVGTGKVSVTDDIFEAVGNSVILIQMHQEIDRMYPGIVKVVDLFNRPTIRQIAAFIQETSAQRHKRRYPPICLPENWFVPKNVAKPCQADIAIRESQYAALARAARHFSTPIGTLVFISFAYALAGMTAQETLHLPGVINRTNQMELFEIDFSGKSSFSELLEDQQAVKIVQTGPFTNRADDWEDKGKYAIVPLVYNKSLLNSNVALSEQYDLCLAFDENSGTRELSAEIRSSRLAPEKLRSLVGVLGKTLELLTKETAL